MTYEANTETIESALVNLASATECIANAICPRDAAPAIDAAGGYVGSLAEAIMGMTAGLCRIADSIEGLADAVRSKNA